jgi:DNA modification methylase
MTIRLLTGDCRDVLPTLADASVHCCITSPPYYGLRDYGTALWDGGDANCDHGLARRALRNAVDRSGVNIGIRGTERDPLPRGDCQCGARRVDRQLGLESSPDAYLAAMVAVFREVRRVLRDDGTCWVNMGDSYASSRQQIGRNDEDAENIARRSAAFGTGVEKAATGGNARTWGAKLDGAKPKDLLLMPARLALALQADGWWVRSDIIWAKPNPMPESVRDRPTRSHEYIFLLTKAARYYYDAQGIAEPLDRPEEADRTTPARFGGADKFAEASKQSRLHSGNEYRGTPTGTRNSRSVWTIATHAFPSAHFATYPPELVARCIRAGTSERGCCAACGAPWVRQTTTLFVKLADRRPTRKGLQPGGSLIDINSKNAMGYNDVTTTGWAASCACGAEVVPATVCDPFSGAGTTALVADRLGRDAIGIDLSHQYVEMTRERITADCPLFTSWAPAEDPEEARMRDLFQDMAAD